MLDQNNNTFGRSDNSDVLPVIVVVVAAAVAVATVLLLPFEESRPVRLDPEALANFGDANT